ncbi:HD domain-containing protein [Luteolibacter pohnpeiensis]|uniref:HD domain-containing protein n=1 Tax=Luteolibacter pohnpeiensis TaxID=454153 RepID=A0A934S828_9BACT|nr:HD domain-containing protein [Luteolibacter pohnpeiensis]MBK1882541.1 HD domain-containing protein [Luteolibacter pohnpeiensis]
MSPISIATLKEQAGEVPISATVASQLQSRSVRTTKGGKPYLEVVFSDSTGSFPLKIWSDSPVYEKVNDLADGAILQLEGEWTQNQYGLNANHFGWSLLDDEGIADFLSGDPTTRAKQDAAFAEIQRLSASIGDPRIRLLCERFLSVFGDRFRRTAAARKNHHARRGGLVEHVAQMMQAAEALCPVYPELNRDLLLCGVLFHDCGKLWENTYPENSFAQAHNLHGEMLGHIPLGIELLNKLWNDLMDLPEAEAWADLSPSAEMTRLHLLHLIGAHHGQLEFGSPVLPRTPEAFALHHIDNLDAKLEMVRVAYQQSNEIAPGIYDRMFPLPANLVRPLPEFIESHKAAPEVTDGEDTAPDSPSPAEPD